MRLVGTKKKLKTNFVLEQDKGLIVIKNELIFANQKKAFESGFGFKGGGGCFQKRKACFPPPPFKRKIYNKKGGEKID